MILLGNSKIMDSADQGTQQINAVNLDNDDLVQDDLAFCPVQFFKTLVFWRTWLQNFGMAIILCY